MAMQATCSQCGISKAQIANSSNQRAKQMMREGHGGKIVMLKRRPDDVRFSTMASWLLLGLFGAHCFYVGRKTRGWIMFWLIIIYIASVMIFPYGTWDAATSSFVGIHPWREACIREGFTLPTDFLGVAAVIMWAMDSFAVVFGYFKYPVRLGEKK